MRSWPHQGFKECPLKAEVLQTLALGLWGAVTPKSRYAGCLVSCKQMEAFRSLQTPVSVLSVPQQFINRGIMAAETEPLLCSLYLHWTQLWLFLLRAVWKYTKRTLVYPICPISRSSDILGVPMHNLWQSKLDLVLSFIYMFVGDTLLH